MMVDHQWRRDALRLLIPWLILCKRRKQWKWTDLCFYQYECLIFYQYECLSLVMSGALRTQSSMED